MFIPHSLYLPGHTWLHRLHPLTKLSFSLAAAVIIFGGPEGGWSVVLPGLLAILVLGRAGLVGRAARTILQLLTPLTVMLFLIHGLFNPHNQTILLSGMRYTVCEEVAFGLENLGVPRAEMPARIEQALQHVGLTEFRDRSPYMLSGGQQQRLALASMLALEPLVLLLDEPTAMLDPQGRQAVFEIVRKLVHAGTTVVITEHHLEWIARYADRVMVLAQGDLILDGTPTDVLTSPLLLQVGIGWLRYTRAAQQGVARGLWPTQRALPVSLEEAALGFEQTSATLTKQEPTDVDSGG